MHLLHLTQDFTISAQHPIAHLFTKWRLLTQKTNLLSVRLSLWRSAPSAISSTILSYLVRHTKNIRKTRNRVILPQWGHFAALDGISDFWNKKRLRMIPVMCPRVSL